MSLLRTLSWRKKWQQTRPISHREHEWPISQICTPPILISHVYLLVSHLMLLSRTYSAAQAVDDGEHLSFLLGPWLRCSFQFPYISLGDVLASEWSGCFLAKLPKLPSKFLESLDWKWQSHWRAGHRPQNHCLMLVIFYSVFTMTGDSALWLTFLLLLGWETLYLLVLELFYLLFLPCLC